MDAGSTTRPIATFPDLVSRNFLLAVGRRLLSGGTTTCSGTSIGGDGTLYYIAGVTLQLGSWDWEI